MQAGGQHWVCGLGVRVCAFVEFVADGDAFGAEIDDGGTAGVSGRAGVVGGDGAVADAFVYVDVAESDVVGAQCGDFRRVDLVGVAGTRRCRRSSRGPWRPRQMYWSEPLAQAGDAEAGEKSL